MEVLGNNRSISRRPVCAVFECRGSEALATPPVQGMSFTADPEARLSHEARFNACKVVGLICSRSMLQVHACPPASSGYAVGHLCPRRLSGVDSCGLFDNASIYTEAGVGIYAVMPLDVLGRTRATLAGPTSTPPWPKGLGNLVKPCRAGDRALQLLLVNEECLVSASHQLALITSLPFVHTARRYYRLNVSVRPSDRLREVGNDHPEPESSSNLVI